MMSQAEALMEVVIWLWKAYEKSGGVLTGSDRVQFLDLFSPVIVCVQWPGWSSRVFNQQRRPPLTTGHFQSTISGQLSKTWRMWSRDSMRALVF